MAAPRPRPTLLLLLLAVLLAAGSGTASAAVPAPTAQPSVTGQARSGQLLTVSRGTWSGAPSYAYAWSRCGADGTGCVALTGQTATTYRLVDADVDARVRVTVTATNADGAATASALSPVVAAGAPPTGTALPAVTGTARDGQVLAGTTGTWTGTAPIALARRWQRCDELGLACTPIAGTTGAAATLTLTPADVGRTIRLDVTATNADGTDTESSLATAVVVAAPPTATTDPALTGTAREGRTLTASQGTWKGTPTLAYARAWFRCPVGGPCTAIAGATGPTYVLAAADVGATVSATVTATNAAGTLIRPTGPSAVVAPKAPPVASADPVVTGAPRDGQVLASTTGTWTGTPTITHARRWLRCDADGLSCAPLAQTGTSLTLTAADVGATIALEVTATNVDGTGTARSPATPVVAPAPPEATAAPTVTGSPREGQELQNPSLGAWRGTPTITHARQWLRCTGTTCTDIAGATAASYRLTAADVGAVVRVRITGTNAAGAAPRDSAATAVVAAGPPVGLAPPTATGPLPRDGELYTGTLGTWAGTAPLTHARRWLRCASSGGACVPISGEVGDAYRLGPADVGRTVRLEVTATNAQGTATLQSQPSPVIGADPPENLARPPVTGTARDGELLAAGPGTWSGTTAIAYTYAWERCDVVTAACVPIPGANAANHRLTPADVGARVRVRVGATNAGGGGLAHSLETAVVAAAPPAAVIAPALSGPAREGAELTVSTGTWTGTPDVTHAVAWQRCDAAGAACVALPGATGFAHELGPDDIGHTVRALVTASNAGGAATAPPAVSAVVAPAPPASRIAPAVLVSELRDGREVTATPGDWDGSRPLSLGFRWQRCSAAGGGCTDIPGATTATHVLGTADVGSALRVVVRAANAAGHADRESPVTGVVLPNPPVSVAPPVLSGEAEDGAELEADPGEWTGLVPFTTTHRWYQCDAGGEDCGLIPGQTGPRLRLAAAQVGHTVRVEVVRTNAGGTTASDRSPATAPVAPTAPRPIAPPVVLGPPGLGRTLTADPGTWYATPALAYAYRWQRCTPDCADIDGAVGPTYRLAEDDRDASVRVVVTATNAAGAATAASATTTEIQSVPPTLVAAPGIEPPEDGLVAAGRTLRAQPGAWTGGSPITYAYRWRRCDPSGAGCVDVAGATGATYALSAVDVGRRIELVVTATNPVDAVSEPAAQTAVILPEPPASLAAPQVGVVGGALREGARLAATPGSWSGALPLTYTTTWLRCDEHGVACRPIDGVVGPAYVLAADDVGRRIRVRVLAANAATGVTADSSPTGVVAGTPPVAGTRPAVAPLDGAVRVGGRLRAAPGTYGGTGPVRTRLQWQRCAGTAALACDDVPGATEAELVLTEADVGRRLRVVVVAENVAGSVRAESVPTGAVPALPPVSADAPTVTGAAPREGVELQADPGRWSGTAPMDLALQWERCPTRFALSCPRIPGATRARYTLAAQDVGRFVRVTVTAVNGGGRALRSSSTGDEVAPLPPRSTSAPLVTPAALRVGARLTASPGRWAGSTPMTFAFRWQRCDAFGRRCRDLDVPEREGYVLTRADLRGRGLRAPLRIVVTATNAAGSAQGASRALGARRPPAPVPAAPRDGRSRPSQAVVAVRAIGLTRRGQVVVRIACPTGAPRRCTARGAVVAGRVRRAVAVRGLAPGRTLTRSFALRPGERRGLRGASRLAVRVRLVVPGRRGAVQRRALVAVPGAVRRR